MQSGEVHVARSAIGLDVASARSASLLRLAPPSCYHRSYRDQHCPAFRSTLNPRLYPAFIAPPSACCPPPPCLSVAVCGIIGSRTDAELRDLFGRLDTFDVGFFSNSRAVELVQHLINKGSLQVGGGGKKLGIGSTW